MRKRTNTYTLVFRHATYPPVILGIPLFFFTFRNFNGKILIFFAQFRQPITVLCQIAFGSFFPRQMKFSYFFTFFRNFTNDMSGILSIAHARMGNIVHAHKQDRSIRDGRPCIPTQLKDLFIAHRIFFFLDSKKL